MVTDPCAITVINSNDALRIDDVIAPADFNIYESRIYKGPKTSVDIKAQANGSVI